MHPDTDFSRTIPNSQSPANDALGVVAAAPTAGGGVGPYTPDLIDARKLAAFCNALIRVDARGLAAEDRWTALNNQQIAYAALEVLELFAEKRRIDAAAAHAYEMQSGGVAHG